MARDDNQILIKVKHKHHPGWGIGNCYDVMPQTDMALVAFEAVDTDKYGFDQVFRNWYHLSQFEIVE